MKILLPVSVVFAAEKHLTIKESIFLPLTLVFRCDFLLKVGNIDYCRLEYFGLMQRWRERHDPMVAPIGGR